MSSFEDGRNFLCLWSVLHHVHRVWPHTFCRRSRGSPSLWSRPKRDLPWSWLMVTPWFFGQNRTHPGTTSEPNLSSLAQMYIAKLSHTFYLSFFLHRQNFWRINFTPKNATFSRFICKKNATFSRKICWKCQFFALNMWNLHRAIFFTQTCLWCLWQIKGMNWVSIYSEYIVYI